MELIKKIVNLLNNLYLSYLSLCLEKVKIQYKTIIYNLLLNLRSPRDCGSCRRAVRACGTSLVRWMALQCAKRTARRLVII